MLKLSGFLPLLTSCGTCGKELEAARWAVRHPPEFVCRECHKQFVGSRLLSPAGTTLLKEILKKKPQEVAAGAGHDAQAVHRLATVNRLLIHGHIGKELRTVRYLDRLRRGTRKLRFHTAQH